MCVWGGGGGHVCVITYNSSAEHVNTGPEYRQTHTLNMHKYNSAIAVSTRLKDYIGLCLSEPSPLHLPLHTLLLYHVATHKSIEDKSLV